MTETVLQEADRLINGDRAKDYGDVTENFGRIAAMWGAYKGATFSEHDVAQMMVLVKVARQATGYHRDSIVDIAGYAALDEKVQDALLPSSVLPRKARFPRKWDSLAEVPHDVKARDREHDVWSREFAEKFGRVTWGFRSRSANVYFPCDTWKYGIQSWDHLGPFTEVLEGQ